MFDVCIENWGIISQLINHIELKKNIFPPQPNEVEVGNREYKLNLDYSKYSKNKLISILNKKATQMNFRILEGGGTAIYFIGISDIGDNQGISIVKLFLSLLFFTKIVTISKSKYKKVRIYKGKIGYIATIRVSKKISSISLLLEL